MGTKKKKRTIQGLKKFSYNFIFTLNCVTAPKFNSIAIQSSFHNGPQIPYFLRLSTRIRVPFLVFILRVLQLRNPEFQTNQDSWSS